jgi:ATP-dependent Clp protease ATP-binding subunit ClpC
VKITDEAIIAAAELSDRYVANRFLPDKAIDLIDQAAARVRIGITSRPPEVAELDKRINALKRERESASLRKKFEDSARLTSFQASQNLLKPTISSTDFLFLGWGFSAG